jgi:hypothetical protein
MSWVDTTADVELLDVQWADRPDVDTVVQDLLDAAHVQCQTYLGAEPESITANLKLAEILQARALHRSGYVGTGNAVGADFPITVFPMDWNVKRLLRPAPAVPKVG